jgi:hypothetical protein
VAAKSLRIPRPSPGKQSAAIVVADEVAAYKLAQLRFTGVFYQSDPTDQTNGLIRVERRSATDLELLLAAP